MDYSLGELIAETTSDDGGLSEGLTLKLNWLVRGGSGALSGKGFKEGPEFPWVGFMGAGLHLVSPFLTGGGLYRLRDAGVEVG
jgi:hypothetical protein